MHEMHAHARRRFLCPPLRVWTRAAQCPLLAPPSTRTSLCPRKATP